MLLAQIDESKLRAALKATALIYLEKHPLEEHHHHHFMGDFIHKLTDLFDLNGVSLVMCRVVKMADDRNVTKEALVVVASVLFQHFRTNHDVTFPLMQQFLKHNPLQNHLLDIAAKLYVQQENLATRHKFHIYDANEPSMSHFYYAFLSLFTIAAEENPKQFDAAVVNYLCSQDIRSELHLPGKH